MKPLPILLTGRPRSVAAAILVVVALGGLWGLTVFDRLNLAGYGDPNSESARADQRITDGIGRQTPDVVVIYTAPPGQTVDDVADSVRQRLASIDATVLSKPIQSCWTSDAQQRKAYVSTNRTQGLAILTLTGDDNARLRAFNDLKPKLEIPGLETQFAGFNATTAAANDQSKKDIFIAEAVAVPITLVLLVIVFGSGVAALVPIAVAGFAVFGSLGLLRLVSEFTDVSAFAINISSILGLGLSIDYSLFVISRFREELRHGHTPQEAVRRTVPTAGRTVAFSALLLVCGFTGMLVFPTPMLRALGFSAAATVLLAALLSAVVVPAILGVLGHRINALSWRRGVVDRGEVRSQVLWATVAKRVTSRPGLAAAAVLVVIALIALPITGLKIGGFSANSLPRDNSARLAQQELAANFPLATIGVNVVIAGDDGTKPQPAQLNALKRSIVHVPGVALLVPLGETADAVILHAVFVSDFDQASSAAVHALRQIKPPPGVQMLLGGDNAVMEDSNAAVAAGFPAMFAIMMLSTFVLTLIAFKSVLLPLKAILMSALSLFATFGILTWLFEDPARADFLGVTAAPLPSGALVMVVAVVYGLSTDYEVFLISRMVEAHDDGANTNGAIVAGMAKTGRTITAAAILITVVTGTSAISDVSLVKVSGIGMTVAILIDATLIRMVLVPALVQLMGEANWWHPWPRTARRRDGDPPSHPDDVTNEAFPTPPHAVATSNDRRE